MLRRLPHRRAVPSPPLPQPTTVAAIAASSLMPCLSVRLQRTATLAPLASRSVPALYAFARPLICPALRVHLALAQFTRPPTPIPGDQGVSSSGARRAPSQRGAAPRRPSCCLTSLFGYSGGGAWVATLLVVGGNRRKSESWVASLRSPPRLRATRSIATCFVLASSAGYFSSALRRVLVAIVVWSPSAATSVLSRTSRKAWKSLKGDRPAGPTHGRSDLLRLSPWTFACARPPDAWRLPLVCSV